MERTIHYTKGGEVIEPFNGNQAWDMASELAGYENTGLVPEEIGEKVSAGPAARWMGLVTWADAEQTLREEHEAGHENDIRAILSEIEFTCHWDADTICENGFMCDGCRHQPSDEEKANANAALLPIKWADGYDGGVSPQCPACGEMPYSTEQCIFCGQRFVQDEATVEYSKPPEEVRLDCIMCGGIGSLVGVRARYNGHFHGHCEKCGCTVME